MYDAEDDLYQGAQISGPIWTNPPLFCSAGLKLDAALGVATGGVPVTAAGGEPATGVGASSTSISLSWAMARCTAASSLSALSSFLCLSLVAYGLLDLAQHLPLVELFRVMPSGLM